MLVTVTSVEKLSPAGTGTKVYWVDTHKDSPSLSPNTRSVPSPVVWSLSIAYRHGGVSP